MNQLTRRKAVLSLAAVSAIVLVLGTGVKVVEAATSDPVASCTADPTLAVGSDHTSFTVECSVPNQTVTTTATRTVTTTVTAAPAPPSSDSASPTESTGSPGGPAPSTTPPSGESLCTDPVASITDPAGTWAASYDHWGNPNSPLVNQDIWGPSGSRWSQELDVCSPTSWNVLANFQNNGGAIQTYPDTEYVLDGRTVDKYHSMQTCFGEHHPAGGEWDYGYDVWSDDWNVEIMVWNDWTDTGVYPPSNARAVTIDGVAYHEWKGGGDNEWIYARDDQTQSGCLDMIGIFQDLIAHEPASGLTAHSVPGAIEYGVEIASTKGPELFSITNASLTTN